MAKDKIQLVSGTVSPAGDQWTEIYRPKENPLTWPEVLVLRTMHGEDAVRNLQHAGWTGRPVKQERDRLMRLYGNVVQQVFPGNSPRMEMDGGDEVEGDTSEPEPDDDDGDDDPDPPRNVDDLDHRGRKRRDERSGRAEKEDDDMATEYEEREAKKRAEKEQKVREENVEHQTSDDDPAANDWRQPEPGMERVERKRDIDEAKDDSEFVNQNFDQEPFQQRELDPAKDPAEKAEREQARAERKEDRDEAKDQRKEDRDAAKDQRKEDRDAAKRETPEDQPKVEGGLDMPRKGGRGRGK